VASFLSRILAFLKKGLFGSRELEEDFIKRIKKGDIEYILNQGVPSIEPPPTPGAKPWRVPYIAEGFEAGSMLLLDPEALMYILVAAESKYDVVRAKGPGDAVLERIAYFSRVRPGRIQYFLAVPDSKTEIRVLASEGLVTGLYLNYEGKHYVGAESYKVLKTLYWDDIAFTVTRVKESLLTWSDEALSVYVIGLDNQHKYLVNTLNSLYKATVAGEGDKISSLILKRLVDYTKFHFRSEEILMEKYDYPVEKYERHVKEHLAFVDAINKFKKEYDRGEARLTLDVFKFLATWIKNHVAGTDRDYGRYFLEIGVANYKPKS